MYKKTNTFDPKRRHPLKSTTCREDRQVYCVKHTAPNGKRREKAFKELPDAKNI